MQRELRANREARRPLPATHPYVNLETLSEASKWIRPKRFGGLDRSTRLQAMATAVAIAGSCPPVETSPPSVGGQTGA
jgi:hypothetical protein